MLVKLPDVTLCALSNANIALTQRAIDICRSHVEFGDTLFLTRADIKADYRVENTVPLDMVKDGSNFFFKNISPYIKTSHVLFVQWDGYIINPDAWQDNFLKYDYIGAKWPLYSDGMNVGNSGFCLRSKRLLDVLALDNVEPPNNVPEDSYVCRAIRRQLEEQYGIQFAPAATADQFSFERSEPSKSFGFHGLFNFHHVMFDDEFIRLLPDFEEYVIASSSYRELAQIYDRIGKFDVSRRMLDYGNSNIQK